MTGRDDSVMKGRDDSVLGVVGLFPSGRRLGEGRGSGFTSPGDGGSSFLVGFAFAFGFALVPVLLAFGYGELAFDAAIAEVESGGDEREALLLRLSP